MPDIGLQEIDGNRRAFARFTAWVCLVAPAAVMAMILSQQGQPYRLTGPAAFMLSGAFALWLLRRDRDAAAYAALCHGAWLAAVVTLSYSGGLNGNAALALPIIILFSAWLAGIRAMLFLGGATIVVLFGYAFLEMHELLPVRAVTPILQRAFVMSVIVLTATALGYFAARTLAGQLAALAASRSELESKVAALARREQELSLLTERVPAMIAHLGRDRIHRFANSAYARFFGHTPDSILGRRAEEVIGTAAYADIEPGIERVLAGEQFSLPLSHGNAEGESRSLVVELVPDTDPQGAVAGWYALIRDVTESERAGRALRHIVEGTARATGDAFFRALTLHLAQATGLGRAMVAEVLPDGRHARALAYWSGAEFRQGMEYLLDDAPCRQVIEDGEACFPDGVAERFPRYLALAMNGIRGYFGIRLESSAGAPLGVLVVMDTAPINNRAQIVSLATVFAARAAAELERIRAEHAKHAALERFEAIFQNTPNVAIQGYDTRGKVMHWNRASETLYGIPAGEAIGRPIQHLLYMPETARRFESMLAGICASGQPTGPGEWPILLRDGREVWVLSTMFPVVSGGAVAEIFCMDVDITDLKRANESVRRLNLDLEARVAARTAELSELNRELEAFSYSVSHDLRAPLRSIAGFGRLLEQDCAGQLDATGLDYVGRMTRAAQRMAQLIDDLLELGRIDRAPIRPAEVDLGALAAEIVGELRQGAPQRRIEVAIAGGLRATGDPQLLRIALQNLIENAWKYTGKTDCARVAFGQTEVDGGQAFFVRDNGAGFDMAHAAKLFTPFQRLHGPQEFEGTGVGLATVARIVRRHGGRIWAEAAAGQGAVFYFTLG
ncbi:MAG: PAS domain-containing protein [Rhodocyclaceae bacterium]|nr:PAS domain-containing protein [Rhodocyclaceae bacterium]